MKKLVQFSLILCLVFALLSAYRPHSTVNPAMIGIPADTLLYPQEKHFKNLQQLTFGGDNAEAYFSFDGKWLIFQRTNPKDNLPCDQMFIGKVPAFGEKFEYKMVSSGKGRTTCGSFTKD